MQLADWFSLAIAIEESARTRRIYRLRGRYPVEFKPVAKQRHCICGTCATCLDNARWERVFRDKFEDPDYYKPRSLRQESSLNSF
jgi:hypothetical protein